MLLLAFCGNVANADTIRLGMRVIADGDTSGKLLEVAGQPDVKSHAKAARAHAKGGKKASTKATESTSGAAGATNKAKGDDNERWTYHRDGKTIVFVISDGIVASISERKN